MRIVVLSSLEVSMARIILSLCLLFVAVRQLPAQPSPQPEPAKPRPIVIEVPLVDRPPAPGRALRYALLPDPMSIVAGNAAPHWIRAGLAATAAVRHVPLKDWSALEEDVPLDKLPRDQARKVLDGAATALRLAEQAARHEYCHWEYEPLTIQDLDLPLTEIQELRALARLLALRCRLSLAQRRFDEAARTLQTGFALSRHTGEAPILIQNLVGVAIGQIMLQRVEEWLQLPEAPDLYWPLTALPAPFLSPASAIRSEAGMLSRSFPKLRTLARETLSKEQAESMVVEVMRLLRPLTQERAPEWQMRLGLAVLASRVYPEAKRFLSERGRTNEEIEAMPALQVSLLFAVEEYDEIWDELLQWIYLPYWQARPGLEQFEKRIRIARGESFNVFVGLLMPAVLKIHTANTRLERSLATVRCVAAIRADAARRGGRPPDSLKDVAGLPLPIDPVTGQGFDAFYKVEDGKATLEVPAIPHDPVPIRRYIFFGPTK
jgi:hypothetical protein